MVNSVGIPKFYSYKILGYHLSFKKLLEVSEIFSGVLEMILGVPIIGMPLYMYLYMFFAYHKVLPFCFLIFSI